MQNNLRRAARNFDDAPVIAQRTKRLFSIINKLIHLPKMKLTQMQDIGGCRAIVHSVKQVRELDRFYAKKSRMKHEFSSRDDYILNPPPSGYRGIHLVYRFFSDKASGAKYNGLKIEMQLRSQYQHAWATAVETVGTFLEQPLKSNRGSDEWRRFFSLMGSVIALRERTPLVPDTPTTRAELIKELDHQSYILNVEARLKGYAEALQKIEQNPEGAHYFMLKLDPAAGQLIITGFQIHEYDRAQQLALEAESVLKDKPGTDVVLVSVDSIAALPRAYPNYFADTRIFVELLKQALSGHQRQIFTG